MERADWRWAAPAVAMAAWGGNHYSPLLLMYRRIDGYTAVQVDLFFACYVLGLIPGFLLSGPMSDARGRKKPVIIALLLGMLGSVVLALGGGSAIGMCVGRLISGVSVAVAMVVGTSWIKELSSDALPATRARRASLTLTLGFGLGAAVSGALAQWGPVPTLLPYAVQIGLSLIALVLLLRATETLRATGTLGTRPDGPQPSRTADLHIPAAGRRRFYGVVVPLAPWVFGAPALAFVVGPALVSRAVGTNQVGFATLAAVAALAVGAGIQPLVPAIARRTGGREGVVGLGLLTVGIVLLALAAGRASPTLATVAAALLGGAYGICIVAGLVEIQAMADPRSLAGLTGIYYSLTYLGFALPVLLAALSQLIAYSWLLAGLAVICLGCAGMVARNLRTA